MTSRINMLIINSIVRIETNQGQTGTGFFYLPDHILTCAHVIRDEEEQASEIRIYHQGLVLAAKVKNASKIDYPDVAVLEILNFRNNSILPFSAEEELEWGKEYLASGYQFYDRGQSGFLREDISLRYEGHLDPTSNVFFNMQEGHITKGMSGAPLVDKSTGRVVGLVKRSRSLQSDRGAHVIPFFKVLEFLEANKLSDNFETKAYNSIIKTQDSLYLPKYENLVTNIGKLILISVVIAFLLTWWIVHMGKDYSNLVLIVLPSVLYGLNHLLKARGGSFEKERVSLVKSISKGLFNKYVLMILSIGTIALWLLVSSIRIRTTEGFGKSSLVIRNEQDKNFERNEIISDANEVERFLVLTPFYKRKFSVEPEGYLKKIVNLSPWGVDIDFPANFSLEPILYVRIPCVRFNNNIMESSALLIISRQDTLLNLDTKKGIGAYYFGARDYSFDRNDKNLWQEELELTFGEGSEANEIINFCKSGWGDYERIKKSTFRSFEQGKIQLKNTKTGKILNEASFDFTSDKRLDILLK